MLRKFSKSKVSPKKKIARPGALPKLKLKRGPGDEATPHVYLAGNPPMAIWHSYVLCTGSIYIVATTMNVHTVFHQNTFIHGTGAARGGPKISPSSQLSTIQITQYWLPTHNLVAEV